MSNTCLDCKHFRETLDAYDTPITVCRLNPPSLPNPHGPLALFPQVQHDSTCGQHASTVVSLGSDE